ncbi:hypothetical protein ABQF29_03690 [Mycolicibacter minnesotensis]
MHGVNCWLMGLSFLLGLLLTFAFTIRRVKREVPVSATPGAAGGTLPSESETSAMAVGGSALRRGLGTRRCRRRRPDRLDDQGQRGLDAVPHHGQPLV